MESASCDCIAPPADTLLTRRPGVQCHELDGEAVLYDPAQHSLHYLNATAYLIWQSCDGQTAAAAVLDRVASAFNDDAPPPMVELEQALSNLIENGLVDRGRM